MDSLSGFRDAVPGGASAAEPTPHADDERLPLLHSSLAFLNEATARIGASLDKDHIAGELCDVLVSGIADFAAVHLTESLATEGQLDRVFPDIPDPRLAAVRRVAVAHDGDHQRWSPGAPQGAVHMLRSTSPLRRAMVTGEPVLVSRVDVAVAAELAEGHPTGDSAALMRGCSLLAVPLRVRGQTLGVVLLLRRPERPPFHDTDALMAGQLSMQAGLGVHNAHLYQTQSTVADALQRSMLPTLPSRIAGVEIASRYLSSSDTAQVGGDWFDTIPLPGGRVAFVVGDVMGHGIRSAAAMGQFRTAVQTLAALDLPPHQVLRHLDDLAQQLGDDYLATCVYAVYDPVARRCTFANAGHIPPGIMHRDGKAELLDLPAGAPIGLGGVAFEPVEVPVTDGDVLVLCTDGVVEERGHDLGDQLERLCASLGDPGQRLDTLCEGVLEALRPADREDDAALLMARLHGICQGNVAHWYLQPRDSTPARVRRLVRTTLDAWGLSTCSEITELLATELVTNSIRHASRPIELRLLRTDALLCEVADDDHHRPVLRRADATDEDGRGLQLVSNLARRWGTSATPSGKVVWFEQEFPEPDTELS